MPEATPDPDDRHPNVRAVEAVLAAHGAPGRVRLLPDAVRTAPQAVALDDHDEVWAAGGIPHAVFPTTFAELVRITGGEPAVVGEGAA